MRAPASSRAILPMTTRRPMARMRRLSVLLALALGGCGPAQPPGSAPPARTRTVVRIDAPSGEREMELYSDNRASGHAVAGSVEQVWSRLPAVYEALGMPGAGVVDPARRVFGRAGLRAYGRLGEHRLSSFIDCGSSFSGDADTYQVTLTVVTAVAAAGEGGSTVQSWVEATGRQPGSSTTPARCTSKGKLEQEIARRLNVALLVPPRPEQRGSGR